METATNQPARPCRHPEGRARQAPLTTGWSGAANRRTTGWIAAGLAGPAAVAALAIAPADRTQGNAQRLMYLHVPAAWAAYLAFGVVLVASLGYLVTGDLRWDRCARAAAEIGVGLTGLTIALGSIWGRAVWGAWWAWDPRLVSTVLLLLVYAGYLAARAAMAGRADHRVARRAAIGGSAAFAMIPVVHFSVVWWRSLHQQATVLGPNRPPIEITMGVTLALSVLAFTAAATWIFLRRVAALEAAVMPPVRPRPATATPTPSPVPEIPDQQRLPDTVGSRT